ncbi:hypothetical protein QYF61_004989 [Mycteria americana]|uniref:Phospholipase A2-like central domain-containing protein n=1 Tax=Mycteria americana TaxID=33587 RepID=A0AAN7MTM2_MYCAM|nr:hypothetical protein QYF61_004989 [Mycteria americana]
MLRCWLTAVGCSCAESPSRSQLACATTKQGLGVGKRGNRMIKDHKITCPQSRREQDLGVVASQKIYEGTFGEARFRNRRGILELAGAIRCTTGRSPFAYLRYGCYCGLGGRGWPKDRVDWCCFNHDCCYGKAEQAGCHPKTESYHWECEDNAAVCESQSCIGWKRPLRSSSPTVNLTLPRPPLHPIPKHLIQTSFKYFQGWQLNHFPGQPVPMLDNPFSEVKFPNIQSKPPLAQLEAISSCPITCYLGEETDPHLSTPSFQVVEESNKVSPQPPFLQAKQPQVPQPLPIRLLLQTLHQLRCPSLDTLQPLNVSLVGRGPKLNTVFEVRPHQGRVQGHDHCPSPAGHAIFDTSQDAIGFLGHLGTLLAHIQAAVNQHSQHCMGLLWPKCRTQLVEPHTIGPSPSIQPVQIPLQSLPPLKQINTPTQLGVTCKLTEGALDPLIQIIDKDIKQNWPQHKALGNTACDRPPTGGNSIHHHSLGPAIQPVLYPAKSTPVQAPSSQFLQENAVGNRVKGFSEV